MQHFGILSSNWFAPNLNRFHLYAMNFERNLRFIYVLNVNSIHVKNPVIARNTVRQHINEWISCESRCVMMLSQLRVMRPAFVRCFNGINRSVSLSMMFRIEWIHSQGDLTKSIVELVIQRQTLRRCSTASISIPSNCVAMQSWPLTFELRITPDRAKYETKHDLVPALCLGQAIDKDLFGKHVCAANIHHSLTIQQLNRIISFIRLLGVAKQSILNTEWFDGKFVVFVITSLTNPKCKNDESQVNDLLWLWPLSQQWKVCAFDCMTWGPYESWIRMEKKILENSQFFLLLL